MSYRRIDLMAQTLGRTRTALLTLVVAATAVVALVTWRTSLQVRHASDMVGQTLEVMGVLEGELRRLGPLAAGNPRQHERLAGGRTRDTGLAVDALTPSHPTSKVVAPRAAAEAQDAEPPGRALRNHDRRG